MKAQPFTSDAVALEAQVTICRCGRSIVRTKKPDGEWMDWYHMTSRATECL